MAPCRFCKHQGVAAGGLALLAATMVVVGLALPDGAAVQQQAQDADKGFWVPRTLKDRMNLVSVKIRCRHKIDLLSCALGQEKDIQGCCGVLMFEASIANDCGCAVLRVIKGRGIDLNNVCNTPGIEKACQGVLKIARKAQENKVDRERAAKEREDELSNLH